MKGPVMVVMHPIFPILLWLAPLLLAPLDAWGLSQVRSWVPEEPEPVSYSVAWAADSSDLAELAPGLPAGYSLWVEETPGAPARALLGLAGAGGGGGTVVMWLVTAVIWLFVAGCYFMGVVLERGPGDWSIGQLLDVAPEWSLSNGNAFKYGTFQCFDKWEYCLFGFCCHAERTADTLSALGIVQFWTVLLPALLVWFLGGCASAVFGLLVDPMVEDFGYYIIQIAWAFFLAKKRQQLRAKLGGESGPSLLMDSVCYWWCSCCTIIQDARQVDGALNTVVGCPCTLEKLSAATGSYDGAGIAIGPPVQVVGAPQGQGDKAADVPSYWVNQIETPDFDVRIHELDKVVGQIQKLFDVTWKSIVTRDRSGPTPVGLKVMRVTRFEDRRMWSDYVEVGNGIRRKRGSSCARIDGVKTGAVNIQQNTSGNDLDVATNEFLLFHGTSPEGADKIAEDGFRLDLTGSNAGNMFGPGLYFAECCSKSDEYAKEGSGVFQGIYAMLLCRVTCGKMFRMLKSDDAKITELMRSDSYDSVLGDREASVNTYREFVVYRERQIYPEYVVLYQRVLSVTV